MERIETVFSTFEEAMEVHKKLFEILREKGVVYYKDLVDMSFLINDDRYKEYGWKSLNDMTIGLRPTKRWALKMPELVKIEKEID